MKKKLTCAVLLMLIEPAYASDTSLSEQSNIINNAIILCRAMEASGSEYALNGSAKVDAGLNFKKLKIGDVQAKLDGFYQHWQGIPQVAKDYQFSENYRMSDCNLKAFDMLSNDLEKREKISEEKEKIPNDESIAINKKALVHKYIFSGGTLILSPGIPIDFVANYGINPAYLEITTPENKKVIMTEGEKDMISFRDNYYYISFEQKDAQKVIIYLDEAK